MDGRAAGVVHHRHQAAVRVLERHRVAPARVDPLGADIWPSREPSVPAGVLPPTGRFAKLERPSLAPGGGTRADTMTQTGSSMPRQILCQGEMAHAEHVPSRVVTGTAGLDGVYLSI